jgi:hypothetical protein
MNFNESGASGEESVSSGEWLVETSQYQTRAGIKPPLAPPKERNNFPPLEGLGVVPLNFRALIILFQDDAL